MTLGRRPAFDTDVDLVLFVRRLKARWNNKYCGVEKACAIYRDTVLNNRGPSKEALVRRFRRVDGAYPDDAIQYPSAPGTGTMWKHPAVSTAKATWKDKMRRKPTG